MMPIVGFLTGLAGTIELRISGGGVPGPTLLELCSVLLFWTTRSHATSNPTSRWPRALWIPMAYLAWILLTGVTSPIPDREPLRAARDVAGTGLCTLLLIHWIKRGGPWQTVAVGWGCGAIGQALLGICQFTLDGPFLQPVSENLAAKTDISGELMAKFALGLFNHPNGLALLLLPAIVGFGGLVLSRSRTLLAWPGLATCILALWLTAAKGVILWAAAGLALITLGPLWQKGPRPFRHAPMAMMLLLNIAILYYTVWPDADGNIQAPTVLTRVNMWVAGAVALGPDPLAWLLGRPSGDMDALTLLLSRVSYANCHSTWWNQILYYGIPGFAGYMAVTWSGASAWWSLCRRPGSPLAPATGLAMLLAVVGEALFEPAGAGVSSPFTWLALSMLPHALWQKPSSAGPPSDETA